MLSTSVPYLIILSDLALQPMSLTMDYFGVSAFQTKLGSDAHISSFLNTHGLEVRASSDKVTAVVVLISCEHNVSFVSHSCKLYKSSSSL